MCQGSDKENVMAIENVVSPKHMQGTAAEFAAMTTAQKAILSKGSTFWVWDTKVGYVFAAGDWRPVA